MRSIFSGTSRILLSLAVGAILPLYAQITGSIGGSVTDPSGAPSQGAAITVRDRLTGLVRTAETDSSGQYLVPQLPPGLFEVSTSQTGLQTQAWPGVAVEPGRTVRIDFALKLAESRETILVTSEAPLVDPGATVPTRAVSEEQYASLPLNGRDVFQLVGQQPGVVFPAAAKRLSVFGYGNKFQVNGSRATAQAFLLDGLRINDHSGGAPASASGGLLGVESVHELKLVSNPYSAEYGQASGGVLTIVSKSGGNAFHGAGYEYLRNSWLDAKNFFDRPDLRIPRLQRNQFGGVLSGPVQHDRLFFFANYEGLREASGATLRPAVPTAQARSGELPDGRGGVRQVPVSPVIQPYLALYPLPNGRDLGAGAAEYINEVVRPSGEDFGVFKSDFLPTPAIRISGRYNHIDSAQLVPDAIQVLRLHNDAGMRLANLHLQQILSPRTIQAIRVGFNRSVFLELVSQTDRAPRSISFVENRDFGTMAVTGLEEIGGLNARGRPRRNVTNGWQFSDEWTLLRGRHSWRFGGGGDRIQFNQISEFASAGYYQFTSLADFLGALPNQGQVMLPTSDAARGWRQTILNGYFQEEFRAHRFTAGLGMRYEFTGPPDEVNGKVANVRNWLTDSGPTTGGPIWRNPSNRNFAPRASVAWNPFAASHTVIRAGAGIYYDLLGIRDVQITGVRVAPFFQRVTIPRPQFPDILAAAQSAAPIKDLDTTDFQTRQPYVIQWQASIERQLSPAMRLDWSYSGSRGIHLISQLSEANSIRPVLQPDGRLFFPAGGPRLNPSLGAVALRRTQFNSFYEAMTLQLQRRLSSGVRLQAGYTWGKSIDEYSGSVSADFDTGDRIPTMFDYRSNRGRSDFDVRHVFTANFSWRLPGPRVGFRSRILGGWELHGLSRLQAGQAFSPFVGFDRARLTGGIMDLGQRPNLTGTPAILGDPSRYFDPFAYGLPDAGYYGNLGRNTLSGPCLFHLDAALHKTILLNETNRLRLRLEVFNATNRPNFGLPSGLALFDNTGQRLGTAGRITSTVTTARQIQIAVRWEFDGR